MSTDIAPVPPSADRDTRGLFLPGNKLGKSGGNPNSRKIGDLNRAFLDCGTPDIVAELFELTLKQAREGDIVCLRYLLDKLTGRAVQAVEVSSVEQGPALSSGTRLTQIFLGIIGDDPAKKAAFAAALRGESSLTLEVDGNGTGDRDIASD